MSSQFWFAWCYLWAADFKPTHRKCLLHCFYQDWLKIMFVFSPKPCWFFFIKKPFAFFCSLQFAVLLWSQPCGEWQRSWVPTVCHAAVLPHVGGDGHCHLHEKEHGRLQYQPRCLHSMIRELQTTEFFFKSAHPRLTFHTLSKMFTWQERTWFT